MTDPVDFIIDATNAANALDPSYVMQGDLVRCFETARDLIKEANELTREASEYVTCLETLKRGLVEEMG
jgi:hypothetical protein